MAIATINKAAEGYCTYYFNKNVNQYYISGLVDGYLQFKGIYNNGVTSGIVYNGNRAALICTANSVGVRHPNGAVKFSAFMAVIIYPAIYGDVTIS